MLSKLSSNIIFLKYTISLAVCFNHIQAEFYSMDLEMTGIKTNDFESYADFPYEKYLKV
jgi:hypothetical protein